MVLLVDMYMKIFWIQRGDSTQNNQTQLKAVLWVLIFSLNPNSYTQTVWVWCMSNHQTRISEREDYREYIYEVNYVRVFSQTFQYKGENDESSALECLRQKNSLSLIRVWLCSKVERNVTLIVFNNKMIDSLINCLFSLFNVILSN